MLCPPDHQIATNGAYRAGTVLVAAAGNEFEQGNPSDQSPSADPHVITVTALERDLSSASFSNEHDGVDLSAPGVGVLAAVPLGADQDGTPDGYMPESGTSFASPIVAAATTWVAALRPTLDHTQPTDLIRASTSESPAGSGAWVRSPRLALRARSPGADAGSARAQ